MRSLAIAVVLALTLTAIPTLVPAAEEVLPVGSAHAGPPCIIGQNGCIIPMYCVTEPCPSYP